MRSSRCSTRSPTCATALATAEENELAGIFDAFDLTATETAQEKATAQEGRSLNSVIAGGRFGPISDRRVVVEQHVGWEQNRP